MTSKHLESRTLLISVGLKLEKNIHTFQKQGGNVLMVLLITCDTCTVAAGFKEYVEYKTDRQTYRHLFL